MLPQLLISGLALGAAYALVALGFVLVLNASPEIRSWGSMIQTSEHRRQKSECQGTPPDAG